MKRNSAGLLHQQEMKDDLDFVTFRKYTEVICLLINDAWTTIRALAQCEPSLLVTSFRSVTPHIQRRRSLWLLKLDEELSGSLISKRTFINRSCHFSRMRSKRPSWNKSISQLRFCRNNGQQLMTLSFEHRDYEGLVKLTGFGMQTRKPAPSPWSTDNRRTWSNGNNFWVSACWKTLY